jgi:hypothetical protein
MVGRTVEIVTRSGTRAGHGIDSWYNALGRDRNPGHRWSLGKLRYTLSCSSAFGQQARNWQRMSFLQISNLVGSRLVSSVFHKGWGFRIPYMICHASGEQECLIVDAALAS